MLPIPMAIIKALGHTEPQPDLLSLPFLLRELVTSLVLKWEDGMEMRRSRSSKSRERRDRGPSIINAPNVVPIFPSKIYIPSQRAQEIY
jgi:hypothetical protein